VPLIIQPIGDLFDLFQFSSKHKSIVSRSELSYEVGWPFPAAPFLLGARPGAFIRRESAIHTGKGKYQLNSRVPREAGSKALCRGRRSR